jgi:hypothetical protein
LKEQLLLNGVAIDPSTLTHADLLSRFESEANLFRDLTSVVSKYSEEEAKEVFIKAGVSFETPRSKAVSLAVPSVDKPLKFINLVQAYKNTSYAFMRGSFLEGGKSAGPSRLRIVTHSAFSCQ